MDLIKLHYFYSVAKYENISLAAKALLISQPALSKAISNLENELEMDLFFRKGKRITLNENGRFLYQQAMKIFREVDSLEKALAERRGEGNGQLAIVTTLPYTITKIIDQFIDEYPTINVRQLPLSKENQLEFIENGKYDICITTEQMSHSNVEWIPLYEEEIFLTLPNTYAHSECDEIDLHQLKDVPFIGLTGRYSFRQLTDQFCQKLGYEPQYRVEVEEATAILQLVKSGRGAAFTPRTAIHQDDRDIKHLKITNEVFTRTIGLLKHKYSYHTKISEAFMKHCFHYFNNYN